MSVEKLDPSLPWLPMARISDLLTEYFPVVSQSSGMWMAASF